MPSTDKLHGSGEKRLSWPVLLLTLAAVTSSSLSALSLYQFVALRAEVEALKSDMSRRREEGPDAGRRGQVRLKYPSNGPTLFSLLPDKGSLKKNMHLCVFTVSQSCLQLLANSSRKPFSKGTECPFIGIPWQAGLRRGSALEADGDRIVVREEGLYFVYSQVGWFPVFYTDKTFTMGHVVIRWKHSIVGNEDPDVHLFRCIQSMSPEDSYNTCYTGGVVKLDVGDHLELLIPRATANISLDGDSTFLGAFKLI
uniref:TNF superfamily member 13b n=1 Tax=Nothobranchius furzeri TaxID=105023 RepID=A0A8C6L0X4_NOTFU